MILIWNTLWYWFETHTLILIWNSHTDIDLKHSDIDLKLTLWYWFETHTLILIWNSHSDIDLKLTLWYWFETHTLILILMLSSGTDGYVFQLSRPTTINVVLLNILCIPLCEHYILLPRACMRSKGLSNRVVCLSVRGQRNIVTAEIRSYSLRKGYYNNVFASLLMLLFLR